MLKIIFFIKNSELAVGILNAESSVDAQPLVEKPLRTYSQLFDKDSI